MSCETTPGPGARVGAVMVAVQPLYILTELLTAATVKAPYSLPANTISDLGATTCVSVEYPFGLVPVCSPWHLLINSSFVVFGLLLAVGVLLLRGWLPSGAAATASVGLWVVAGLSSIATGLVPLDQNLELHAEVSLPVFLAQPLAVLITAMALRAHVGLARSGLAVGLVSLAAALAYLGAPAISDFGGLLERLALWPGYLWLPALAVAVVRRRPPHKPASVTA